MSQNDIAVTPYSADIDFLATITPRGGFSLQQLCRDIATNNTYYKQLLMQHGALLFRDFNVDTAETFREISIAFSQNIADADYTGGISPREKVTEGVYTSTYVPNIDIIPQHLEMAYPNRAPKQVFFACVKPAPVGGETPLTDNAAVYDSLDVQDKQYFTDLNLKYTNYFLSQDNILYKLSKNMQFVKKWQEAFATNSFDEVVAICKKNHAEVKKLCGKIAVSEVIPAVKSHSDTKRKYWYATLIPIFVRKKCLTPHLTEYITYKITDFFYKFPYTLTLENDRSLSSARQKRLIHAVEQHTKTFPWKKGDFLILDNQRIAHGRLPFEGEREHLATFS